MCAPQNLVSELCYNFYHSLFYIKINCLFTKWNASVYAKLLARDLPVYLCELFVLGGKRLLRRNFFLAGRGKREMKNRMCISSPACAQALDLTELCEPWGTGRSSWEFT